MKTPLIFLTDVNDCVNHTCQNGSSCVDGINNFTCTVFIRLNDADGSETTKKRRPRINAAPHQKNAVLTRG